MRLAAADEIDDLDLVAVADDLGGVVGAADDSEVALDGDAAAIDARATRSSASMVMRRGQFVRFAVEQ